MSKSKKRAKPIDPRPAKLEAIKERLLDISAGVCGCAIGDASSHEETNCFCNSLDVGNYLAAVFFRFEIPEKDRLRDLHSIEKLVDFDTAAVELLEFIEVRQYATEPRT